MTTVAIAVFGIVGAAAVLSLGLYAWAKAHTQARSQDPALKPPEEWAHDPLSAFIETARQNIFATFANLKSPYNRLRDIDRLFVRATENLHGLRDDADLLPATFLLRAHSSYRGACQLALSGQLPEAYMVLRGCLENSLYGLFLYTHPEKAETWPRRSDDDASKRKVKAEFQVGPMLSLLDSKDAVTGKAVHGLYELTIDFGAHPNELALTSNARAENAKGARRFELSYLTGDSTALRLCLKTTAQVGVGGLRIFRLIFRERFELLEIPSALQAVSQKL